MRVLRPVITLFVGSVVVLSPALYAQGFIPGFARHQPNVAQFIKPGLPLELVSAKKADRIAWVAYEEGKRNVFTAAAPLYRPVRATSFLKDDGVDLTGVKISDDGSTVVFVRGHQQNNDGWVANPGGNPAGTERAIWAAKVATPGVAWRLAEGSNPEVAPDGSSVLYMKDGAIYRARIGAPAVTPIDKGEKPFVVAWGQNNGPRWSPDGTRIAFSSNRVTHAFIGLYSAKTKLVTYVAPSVDRDTSPTWSPDGKKIAFLRRPGLPFGAQPSPGSGSGLPDPAVGGRGAGGGGGRAGAAGRQGGAPNAAAPQTAAPAPGAAPAAAPGAQAAAQNPAAGRQGGGGRGGRGGGEPQIDASAPLADSPGMYRATLPGGHRLAIVIVDIATGDAKEVWHPATGDTTFTNINNIQWIGDNFVFTMPAQGNEEGNRHYAMSVTGTSEPVRLNTTEGIVEDATAATYSKDGKTFYYCTNASDIDRRHIWSVPTSGGTPKQITTGDGIENVPVALASGKQIAVLSADAIRPLSVALWPVTTAEKSAQKVLYPTLGKDFPVSSMVVPTNVTLKSPDGLFDVHNQLFLPKDIKPGEKRAALIFVHGGPQRQMLLGWHYLSFYHVFYGVNQWLTSQGYIVMSVNYRSGVGYGRSFRQAANIGNNGNSEYQDVLVAGKYLAARADVDPNRVGIWGLSYGGLLTANALARNSDIFKAGVDLAGVHVRGSLDPQTVSYQSAAISEIDKWKSPVLLVHGDDDRNVNFAQTVGLVQLLRARNIYHETIVFPDDIHETLLEHRWQYTFDRMEMFLNKFLGEHLSTKSGGR